MIPICLHIDMETKWGLWWALWFICHARLITDPPPILSISVLVHQLLVPWVFDHSAEENLPSSDFLREFTPTPSPTTTSHWSGKLGVPLLLEYIWTGQLIPVRKLIYSQLKRASDDASSYEGGGGMEGKIEGLRFHGNIQSSHALWGGGGFWLQREVLSYGFNDMELPTGCISIYVHNMYVL